VLYEYLEKTNAVVKASVSVNHLRRAEEEFERIEPQKRGGQNSPSQY